MLRERYIPKDILEDIKLGKMLPLKNLKWYILTLFVAVVVSFLIPSSFIRVIIVVIAAVGGFIVFSIDIPRLYRNYRKYKKDKEEIKTIDQYLNLKEIGSVSKTKDESEIVFIEKEVEPWEVSPSNEKESRAVEFSQNVMSALDMGTEVTFFGTCSAENTKTLEMRLENLANLKDGVKELEANRIEYHYNLSKHASHSTYRIRIRKDAKKDIIDDISEAIVFKGTVLGKDAVEDYLKNQLIPDAVLKRGKDRLKEALEKISRKRNRRNEKKIGKLISWIKDTIRE